MRFTMKKIVFFLLCVLLLTVMATTVLAGCLDPNDNIQISAAIFPDPVFREYVKKFEQ